MCVCRDALDRRKARFLRCVLPGVSRASAFQPVKGTERAYFVRTGQEQYSAGLPQQVSQLSGYCTVALRVEWFCLA